MFSMRCLRLISERHVRWQLHTYGLDLEQVHEDQNPDFFTQNGVRLGISRRFVGDIIDWATQYASSVYPEGPPSRPYN